MRKETRDIYITNDGTEFDSEEAAEEHELKVEFLAACGEAGVYWREPDPDAIAEAAVRVARVWAARWSKQ